MVVLGLLSLTVDTHIIILLKLSLSYLLYFEVGISGLCSKIDAYVEIASGFIHICVIIEGVFIKLLENLENNVWKSWS